MYLNTRKQYKWLRFSEDCLYLNVYAPVRARGGPLLPVSTPVFHYPQSSSATP